MYTVQDALKARKERSEKEQNPSNTNTVKSALENYKRRVQSESKNIASDLAKRIKSEVEWFTSFSEPSWGKESVRNYKNDTKTHRSNVSELRMSIDSYKNYLDEESYNNMKSYLDHLDSEYKNQLKVAEGRSQFASEGAYNQYVKDYEEYRKKNPHVLLTEDALNATDFDHYSQIGANIKNPSPKDAENNGKPVGNIVTYSRDHAIEIGVGEVNGGGSRVGGKSLYKFMTDDEVSAYNYYIGKGDTKTAERYLEFLDDTLNQRRGGKIAESLNGNKIGALLFGFASGIEQFAYGVRNLDNLIEGAESDPLSATQYAAQIVGDNMEGGWGVAYDLAQNTGNMLPSILLSSVTGGIGGAATMGVSATGNAYAEMRRLGYGEWQSRGYGVLVGASEAALQYALGGISPLGSAKGGIFSRVTESALNKVDNALARFAINWGSSILDEGIEEMAQSVLEPIFKSILTGEDVDIDWGEVAYSGLLGALSAGVLEGTGTVAGEIGTWTSGKKIKTDASAVERLTKLGSTMSPDSVAYKLAGKIDENTGAYTIGRLLNEVGASLSEKNMSDIVLSLERKGFRSNDAKTIAKWLYKAVEGDHFNKKQREVLEKNDLVAQTLVDVVINPNSTVWQRIKGYEELQAVSRAKTDKATKAKATSTQASAMQEKPTASTENAPVQENATEREFEASENGKTILKSTGEEVHVQGIESIENGAVKLKLDNGETVKASDVEFSSDDEALMYEMVVRMDTNPETAQAVLEVSKPSKAFPAKLYFADVPLAYEYGKMNYEAGLSNLTIPEETARIAYNRGRIDAITDVKAKAKAIAKNATTTEKSSSVRKGKVHYDGGVLAKKPNDIQKASLKGLETLAKALGIDFHIFESAVDENGKRKGANGWFDPKDGSIHIDLFAGQNVEGTMIFTAAHELTHFIREWSPAKFKVFADFLMEQYGKKGVPVDALVKKQIEKAKRNGRNIDFDTAYEEVVADACETMLADGDIVQKIAELKAKDKSLWQKIKDFITDLVAKIKKAYKGLSPDSQEGKYMAEMLDSAEKLKALWTEALVDASDAYTASDIVEKDLANKNVLFNLRATESHKNKLSELYSENASVSLDTIMQRYNKIISIWERIGGELNSKFLTEWNNKVGKDRAFTVFKAQAGYKYNVELSSMCKKGVPLFEAIDTIVKKEVMKELNTEILGKEEKEILYEILSDHNFEIPCAICYVEQARQREGVIIDAFLNGKVEKNSKGETTTFKLGWNEVLKNVEKEMKASGVDYSFKAVDRNIATDKYTPADLSMDEATQDAFYKALKKIANKEISRYNKAEKKNRKLVTSVTPSAIKEVFKGTLPSNLKIFKVMFTEPSSRFTIESDLLYSSMTTHHLAMEHNGLYGLFNSQGGVSGYKTKQGTVVYWGDILGKTWQPSKVRDEGGIRNQSNSDFQMYTLLDQAQMYIDFTAKGYYLQAYTKVLSELKLFGLSRGKINASLIPAVYEYRNADGSVDLKTTREYAGLDRNGNLLFDDVEGINHREAFMLLEDAEYSKSIGGICIGYSDNHILKLLDDSRVQQIIGFHDKTDDPDKRYRGARYAKNYNGLNEAVNNKDGKTVHIGFNPFVRKAEKMFSFNAKTETYEGEIEYNGKTYVADDIPKLAADLYLEMCKKKDYTPAYTDFDFHENYYKLLADFSLYDSQGHYAPHRKVAYNMPDRVPYLNLNGKKQYMSTEDYIKSELEKELKVRDSISEALADTSENGIIPQFKKRVNELNDNKVKRSDRDSDGNKLSKEQIEFFKDSKVRDKDGNLLVAYHGTPNDIFYEFDASRHKSTTGTSVWGKGFYFSDEKASYYWNGEVGAKNTLKCYLNIKNPFYVGNGKLVPQDLKDYIVSTDAYKESSQRRKDYLGNIATRWYDFLRFNVLEDGDANYVLQSLGYDGIIVDDNFEIVVFDSNQAKLTYNKAPTSNPDIRYSDRYQSANTNTDILSMVEKVGNGNFKANEKVNLGTVSDSTATEIHKITGIDVAGFNVAIEARQIAHILKDHGKNGKADRSMADPTDIAKIEYTLENYDDISSAGKTRAYKHIVNGNTVWVDTVLYEKAIGSKSYYVVQAIPDTKAKTLYIVTAFIGKKGYKKEASQFIDEKIPDATPKSEIANTSMGIISQSDDSVKREFSDVDTMYSLREEDPPKKTIEGYKVFVVKNGKLYPPMVANPNAEDTPVGVWLNADVGTRAPDSKTGRAQVKAGGKGTQGGSGSLAFRPGWHLGETPLATQFDRTNPETGVKELFPENFVWALCDIAADHDYQEEAMSYGYTKNGKFQHSLAGLPKLPTDGYYKYRTNPNPDTVPWLITGAMKVKKLLSDAEVNAILTENGLPPKQRVGGDKTLADLGLSQYDGKLFSDRDPNFVSNRSLLANALESVAQNDIERDKLKEYKSKISLIESEQKKLAETREKIKELSFAKGKRDTETINKLQLEANQSANRINTYDRQLLNLESTKALKGVLERENVLLRKRLEQKGKEALNEYREKANQDVEELSRKYQESRKKGIESRHKTEMRRKIKDVVNELNQYLLKGTKEKHVPIELQSAVAEALDAVNMDTVGAEERIAKKREEMMRAKTPEAIEKLAKEIRNIEKIGGNMEEKLSRLKTAYDSIINSDDPLIANSHDEVISNTITKVIEVVGNTPLRDMSLYQLEAVYDMYKMVLASIRNANKAFKMAKSEDISTLANRVIKDLVKQKKKTTYSKKALEDVSKFNWNNLKPVYAFERIGSSTFTNLFNNIRAGEDVWAKDMSEAQEFREEQFRKYNYDSWDFDKRYGFTSTTGNKFELSLDQIMSLYAYSRRDQAEDHLRYGGFVFDELTEVKEKTKSGVNVTYKLTDSTPYKLDTEVLSEIVSKLTSEQKAFVIAMQDYLSTTMGEKGNEVSLALYDVKLFKEKRYFPLKSDNRYLARAREQAMGDVKIKNSGFTKEITPKAKNPITLTPFMDVWAGHVNEMSMYHAFTLPLEDFYRVYNYSTPSTEDMDTHSVVASIENAHRSGAVSYIDQLLKDLNGGAVSDSRETLSKSLVSNFKKASVIASLSVVIQQPSAIVRAKALVDAKYFVGSPAKGTHKEKWAEVKKYAPVAIIKEMGYFDVGMGKGAVDWLKGEKTWKDKIGDALSKAPSYMDEVTWVTIWNAVKRETLHTHKELKPNSEAFLKAVGERFTEVIVKTQVYDSTLARSANMRSKSLFMNMATAFMAEPTTSINMIQDSLRNGKRGKYTLRTLGAVYGSVLLNAALVSVVYAMRDDDEDETFLEKYLSRLTTEVIDGVNPATYIPFLKDIWSILQGYDIERADMSLFSDVTESFTKLVKVIGKDTSDMDEDELADHRENIHNSALSVVDGVASLFGLPVKNVRRDFNGIVNGFSTIFSDTKNTAGSLADNILEDVKNTVPVLGWFPDESKGDKLYDAIVSGDSAYVERLKNGYENEKSYTNAIRKALRENDPRIKEAAEASFAGDTAEYSRIFDEILGEGNFELSDIKAAIDAEIDDLEPDEPSSEGKDKVVSRFEVEHFYNAVIQGDTKTANNVKEDIVNTHVANGKDRDEAESSFESAFRRYVRENYVDGEIDRNKTTKMLTKFGGRDSNDAYWDLKEWDYEKEHGTTDEYSKYNSFYEAVKTGRNIKAVINEYTSHGVTTTTLATQITQYYKPLYLEMTNYERASIKGYLLNAYVLLGYDRSKKSKDIDKWLEK